MTRNVLTAALLISMSLGGMRVICIDGPVDATASIRQTEQTGPTEHGDDCDRLCPWPRRPAESEEGSDCALTADGASFVVMGGTSLRPGQVPLQIEIVVSEADAEAPQLYVEPGLTHLSPPPKTT